MIHGVGPEFACARVGSDVLLGGISTNDMVIAAFCGKEGTLVSCNFRQRIDAVNFFEERLAQMHANGIDTGIAAFETCGDDAFSKPAFEG